MYIPLQMSHYAIKEMLKMQIELLLQCVLSIELLVVLEMSWVLKPRLVRSSCNSSYDITFGIDESLAQKKRWLF